MLVRQFWAHKSWRNFFSSSFFFPPLRYLAHLFNRVLILNFSFQHSRWMGEPRKRHSKKCRVTLLTLVWHVTDATISEGENTPSKLWEHKEMAWMGSKDTPILGTSEVQQSQLCSLGSRQVEVLSHPTVDPWQMCPEVKQQLFHFHDLFFHVPKTWGIMGRRGPFQDNKNQTTVASEKQSHRRL